MSGVSNAFHFSHSEKALPLSKSPGKKKSRLHLFEYNGEIGKDPHAVAAERLAVKAGAKPPKLGWLDKKFYVLHAHQDGDVTTWYKINKKSLCYRLGISSKDLKPLVNKKTGRSEAGLNDVLIQKAESLIAAADERVAKVQKWIDKCDGPVDPLADEFIQQLVDADIPLAPIQKIIFCSDCRTQIFGNGARTSLYLGDETDHGPNNIRHFPPQSILVVMPKAVHAQFSSIPFYNAQTGDFRDFAIKNAGSNPVNILTLPFLEDEYDQKMSSDDPIDQKTIEQVDIQSSLVKKLENECKQVLWRQGEKNPTKARLVMVNGSKQIAVDIPSKKANFPDLIAIQKSVIGPAHWDKETYFPPGSTAFLVAEYKDEEANDKQLLLFDLDKKGKTGWKVASDLLTDPEQYVAHLDGLSADDITRIFGDFKDQPA